MPAPGAVNSEVTALIEVQLVDSLLLRDMILSGAANLEKNRDMVDSLNVFPVPDGDTGTNMSLTMASATREVNSKEFATAGETASAIAKGALRGARGNSGVITSQLLRGFASSVEGLEKINPLQFAQALKAGADKAYKAVMKPKEGTILTVARVIAEEALKQAEAAPDDYDALMRVILTSGESILARTPEMLPVLKQAGVVDAGGRGLMCIYQGYAAAMGGEHIDLSPAEPKMVQSEDFVDDHDAIEELKYIYHTTYTIHPQQDNAKTNDLASLRRHMSRIGDCIQVNGEADEVKVHIHTNDPGRALQYGQGLGELVDVAIENMAETRRQKEAEKAQAEPPKDYGMVSVCQGEGFASILKDLGVDCIVEGGQTMNPAIEDLEKAISSINAKTVFVLPNNGNVVLAAQQAAELSDKNVLVIPTKNVAMGIAAVISFQPDLSPDENAQNMNEAAQRVRTGMITYAVRDSEFEDLHITEGDIIGLHNGAVSVRSNDVHEVALELIRSIVCEDDSLITVYYGADTKQQDAEALGEELQEMYPGCDVEVMYGGQPLYYYLLSVE